MPVIITGTFQHPHVAPDVQQIAQMKLKNMLPNAKNPAELTTGILGAVLGNKNQNGNAGGANQQKGGIGGILDAISGKQQQQNQQNQPQQQQSPAVGNNEGQPQNQPQQQSTPANQGQEQPQQSQPQQQTSPAAVEQPTATPTPAAPNLGDVLNQVLNRKKKEATPTPTPQP
jgi:hypothetical protein